ncbi:hypothetical protein WDZ92_52430, partial [Nostoc sp. NIES-2111]
PFAIETAFWRDKTLALRSALSVVPTVSEGRVSALVKVPANFLNEGEYVVTSTVRKGSVSRGVGEIVAQGSFKIQVVNAVAHDSVWSGWGHDRPGLISPRVDWQVRALQDKPREQVSEP